MTLEPRVKSTMASIRITVLVENTAAGDLLGEHGLAFWIETPVGAAILDTGQGESLLYNAARLGADLSRIKALIVSHGHYGHTGGLAAAMAAAERAAACFYPAPASNGCGTPTPCLDKRRIRTPSTS